MNPLYSPFTAPTSDEIAEADERADIDRSCLWMRPLAWCVAVPFLCAVVITLARNY